MARVYELNLEEKAMAEGKTNLVISCKEAEERINAQIERGKQIRNIPVNSQDSYDRAQAELSKWSDFNARLLERIFDTDEMKNEYFSAGANTIGVFNLINGPTPRELSRRFQDTIQGKIDKLESIRQQLIFFEEPKIRDFSETEIKKPLSNKVFIVHGRDEGAKQSVARFLENLGLKPIILHEQANKGRTIIKKLEDYSDVGYAVVLLTADDVGGLKSKEEKQSLKPRARQNVIFELGFFIGLLGSERVCPLCQEGVERPSDYEAVVYITLDERGAWKLDLAKELKAAKYDIDLNKLQ